MFEIAWGNGIDASLMATFAVRFTDFQRLGAYAVMHHLPMWGVSQALFDRLVPGGVAVFAEPVINSRLLHRLRLATVAAFAFQRRECRGTMERAPVFRYTDRPPAGPEGPAPGKPSLAAAVGHDRSSRDASLAQW